MQTLARKTRYSDPYSLHVTDKTGFICTSGTNSLQKNILCAGYYISNKRLRKKLAEITLKSKNYLLSFVFHLNQMKKSHRNRAFLMKQISFCTLSIHNNG